MYLGGFGQDSTDIMGPTLQEAAGGPVIPQSSGDFSPLTFPWWLVIAAVLVLAVSKNSRR